MLLNLKAGILRRIDSSGRDAYGRPVVTQTDEAVRYVIGKARASQETPAAAPVSASVFLWSLPGARGLSAPKPTDSFVDVDGTEWVITSAPLLVAHPAMPNLRPWKVQVTRNA